MPARRDNRQNSTARLDIRVTPSEKQTIHQIATEQGLKVSELCRQAITKTWGSLTMNQGDMRALALQYNEFGYSVIPIAADSKQPPAGFRWKQWQSEIADFDLVCEWIEDYWPCQLAIVTGDVSNLLVVDLDSELACRQWDRDYGGVVAQIALTPRGCHYYYAMADGMRNTTTFAGRMHCDIRANGGYVLAPPSRGYRWIRQPRPGDHLPVFNLDHLYCAH